MKQIPRLMIAAISSGSGKTTVTCGLLKLLKDRGLSPAAFKCGPDYIDPMFHREVLGVPSHNLDLFFSPEAQARELLGTYTPQSGMAVLEGVMGYYDGIADTPEASSWHLATATETPVLLVVRPKGISLTLAALLQGILGFRQPHNIGGILLNDCSPSLYSFLAPVLERETGIPVVGFLPPMPEAALKSRHLGLVTAGEVENLRQLIDGIARQMAETVDIDKLLSIASGAPPVAETLEILPAVTASKPVVAVARDRAFCFYYQDSLNLLEELGAALHFFSPLEDKKLPDCHALYLGGGYPELYAARLSANKPMRRSILQAVRGGLPTLAECGGFLYLQSHLSDTDGIRHPMVGVLPSEGSDAGRLSRFGYCTLTAQRDNLLCPAGETIAAHEFHRWDCPQTGDTFVASKPKSGRAWPCIEASETLFAGFPHLYLRSNPDFARRFVSAAGRYQHESGNSSQSNL